MAGKKKNNILSFTGNPERQLHTPEYSARTQTCFLLSAASWGFP